MKLSCVRLSIICVLIVTGLLHSATSVSAATMIIENGKANAQIIVAKDAPSMVQLAAAELQRLLEAMSGAKLQIVNEPGDEKRVNIHVGASTYTKALGVNVDGLTNDAYRIQSGKDWLVLAGDDREYALPPGAPVNRAGRAKAQEEWEKLAGEAWVQPFTSQFKNYNKKLDIWAQDGKGTINAVYAWLRTLGAEWYMPGEIGQVLPARSDIALPTVDLLKQADFPIRTLLFYANNYDMASIEEVIWQLQQGLTRHADVIGDAPMGHGITWVIQTDEYAAKYPEHLALFNGKRASTGEHKPCLSSPGLLKSNIDFVNTIFKNYDVPSVSVMPPDGYTSTCQCELCKGKATPDRGWNGQISDYVWQYVDKAANEIAKTYPDRKIIGWAYGAYKMAPLTIDKLSPNLVVGIVQARRDYNDKAVQAQVTKLRQDWLAMLPEDDRPLMIWDHYLWAKSSYANVPVYYPHAIDWDLKSLKGISRGDFIEVYRDQYDQHMIVDSLNLYITTQLLWDASLDVDTLIDTYCTNFYGPAASRMKAFITYCEANWKDMRTEIKTINEMMALLADATSAAPADSIYARRISLLNTYVGPLKAHVEQLAKDRENVKNIRIASRHGMDVMLDGVLNEEAWKVGVHSLSDVETGKPPKAKTTFIAFWKNDSLYLGIKGEEPGAWPRNHVTANEDPTIWNGDCIEILLETQANSYYQIAISPSGVLMDLNRQGGFNSSWSANLQVAASRDDTSWTLEIAIPMADERAAEFDLNNGVAGRRPTQEFPWYINVCRQRVEGKETELTAYSPTGKRQFHVPLKFARIWVK